MQTSEPFDSGFSEQAAPGASAHPLVVDLEGYEGPLDVLLALARTQKVDLAKISILQLADQFLAFINEARRVRLEIAADYLVMAAWLAYLKSKLLLPEEDGDDEPSGPEMAARLAFQLRRLEAMRGMAVKLMARDRLGHDVFARGAPEGIRVIRKSVYELSLYELLSAYGTNRARQTVAKPLTIERRVLFTIEEAIKRLETMLGKLPSWQALEAFLPNVFSGEDRKSVLAAMFTASLELVRRGEMKIRQGEAFGPIYVMGANRGANGGANRGANDGAGRPTIRGTGEGGSS
ncbi:MAG: segregation/condensation protein A [Proteobacteria bacterium]|nr:segregation/condensation protein A [Pseudomonadota bacterium]